MYATEDATKPVEVEEDVVEPAGVKGMK